MTTATAPTIRTCPECGKQRSVKYHLRQHPTHQLCDECMRTIRHIHAVRNRLIYHRIKDKFFVCISDPCEFSDGCQPGADYTGPEIASRIKEDAIGIGAVFEDVWHLVKYQVIAAPYDGLDFVKLEE